ncbi:hypothetical protein VTN00DRAFT_3496 [Thermoascus crustaceus]|uniref:uncharacterized protein n=1 Tax=Thermoascus crustaceus TaxID=5088 RepID=UPI00374217A3
MRRRRAIEDAEWSQIIEARSLIVGDFNAHSPLWNPQAGARTNAGPLEALIDAYNLHINNALDIPTRPKSTPGVSIIDLSLTTSELGPLEAWFVDQDHPTGSDHEVIVMEWSPLRKDPREPSKEITCWQIQALQADTEALNQAMQDWQTQATGRQSLTDNCTEEDVLEEATWIQNTLTAILNQHAKPIRVSPASK